MDYTEFLESKKKNLENSGFDVSNLNPSLFDFQHHITKTALKKGRYAIFADCGLGKTLMQLEWAHKVVEHTHKPVLILAPLAVSGQTIHEGLKFHIQVERWYEDLNSRSAIPEGIYITNYEQLDKIDCSFFSGIVLDESSILKNFSGAYRNLIINKFSETNYKLACTATPSPNDELELGNHAEFLGIMSSQDMRANYFTTDKEIIKSEKYRLKKHAVKDFYKWVSTWAIMISKPSDIGFPDNGFILKGLNYVERNIITSARTNSPTLFNEVSVSATDFNQELRLTQKDRLDRVLKILESEKGQFIVWVKHNEEADYLMEKLYKDSAMEVRGSDKTEYKEQTFIDFAAGKFRILVTKSKIAQFGLNFQNCHNQIFASLDFSFESLYQSIRRSHRFGQKEIVNIYLITTDTMQNVKKSIEEKQEKFIRMQDEMREAILDAIKDERKEDKEVVKASGPEYTMILGDCVEQVSKMESNSIDYSFSSPPFGALYVFSDDIRDMSNVQNNDEFLNHYKFLVEQMHRVIKPGRLVSIHMMQSTTLLGRDGFYSIKDFRGDLIRLYESCGFDFHAEAMIRKDPKTAAIRTKNRQLMWGTTKKDSSVVRPGLADYVLTFKKRGENAEPIVNNIPFDLWCRIAEPVWIEIEEGDTLDYREARDNDDERHITATQLKPIEWLYLMWTNEGDTVLSPFAGIATEGYQALKMGRKFIGIELKESYFNIAKKNCKNAIIEKAQLSFV